MSAQTDAMRANANALEQAVMTPWTSSVLPLGAQCAQQLRTAAANQDTLVGRLASLGITVTLLT